MYTHNLVFATNHPLMKKESERCMLLDTGKKSIGSDEAMWSAHTIEWSLLLLGGLKQARVHIGRTGCDWGCMLIF